MRPLVGAVTNLGELGQSAVTKLLGKIEGVGTITQKFFARGGGMGPAVCRSPAENSGCRWNQLGENEMWQSTEEEALTSLRWPSNTYTLLTLDQETDLAHQSLTLM